MRHDADGPADGVPEEGSRELSALYDQRDAARARAEAARQALRQAAIAAYRALRESGRSTSTIARGLGRTPQTLRKLGADGPKEGWQVQSERFYAAVDAYTAGRRDLPTTGLAELRRALARATAEVTAAEAALQAAGHEIDAATADGAALGGDLRRYLEALVDTVGRTLGWLPYGDLDAGFEQRRVSVSDDPPTVGTARTMPLRSRSLLRGDVRWERAIDQVPVAVVLADAGSGKTWLLRHHGRLLARQALAALDVGAAPAAVAVPLLMHAGELARAWTGGRSPSDAVVAAGLLLARAAGFGGSLPLRRYLADRLRPGAPPVHVLVDAYDEVFDDGQRTALAEALGWLAGMVRRSSGPRLVLTSRWSGYDDPFLPDFGADDNDDGDGLSDAEFADREARQPRYLQLGVLDEHQVRRLWDRWFELRGRPLPAERLEPAIAPRSPLRRFVHVPLIAAFCAWVAEEETVGQARSQLYEQVLRRFLAQPWKVGPAPTGSLRQDGARRRMIEDALVVLAWEMAAARPHWRDAVDVGECESILAAAGLPVPSDRSRTWDPVRTLGILVQAGTVQAGTVQADMAGGQAPAPVLGEGPVLWVHGSVHEFLTARRLVTLGEPAAREVLDERCWSRPEWGNVLDFALGLEAAGRDEARPVTRALRGLALGGEDGLGWYAMVFTAAGAGMPPDPDQRQRVADRVWGLHRAGMLSAASLAELLAGTAESDPNDVVGAVYGAVGTGGPDQATWDALAWCGAPGRAFLAGVVASAADVGGAAAALYRVDPPAAVAALRRRLAAPLPVHAADAAVLRDIDEPDVQALADRYRRQPGSEALARTLGWTEHPLARDLLRSTLADDEPRVRRTAAAGLVASYGNDIDRPTFDLLVGVATADPDPDTRLAVREKLAVIGMSVPWVETALGDVVGTLYRPLGVASLDTPEAIAAALRTTGPATELAVQMLLEGPELVAGPIAEEMTLVTLRALAGDYGVALTSKVARVAGKETFLGLALPRLASGDVPDDPVRQARLLGGLGLAFPDEEEVFAAILDAAPQADHEDVDGVLRLSTVPAPRRLEIVCDRLVGLTEPAPVSVRIWTDLARHLLVQLPEVDRQRFREPFALATTHILDIAG